MPEYSTQAYLGSTPLPYGSLILNDKVAVINPIEGATLPTQSLLGWLDASTYTSTDSWYARQGNATASLSGSTPPLWKSDFGGIFSYTTASVSAITSSVNLPLNILTSSNYTIFVVGRQSGSSTDYHGRMLSCQNSNWLLGTYGGGGAAGPTEYNNAFWSYSNVTGSFTIQSGSIYDTQWRVHTAKKSSTTASYYLNATYITASLNNSNIDGPDSLGLNRNFGPFNELNQMDIGDIVVYNRALSDSEITEVYNIISKRYGL